MMSVTQRLGTLAFLAATGYLCLGGDLSAARVEEERQASRVGLSAAKSFQVLQVDKPAKPLAVLENEVSIPNEAEIDVIRLFEDMAATVSQPSGALHMEIQMDQDGDHSLAVKGAQIQAGRYALHAVIEKIQVATSKLGVVPIGDDAVVCFGLAKQRIGIMDTRLLTGFKGAVTLPEIVAWLNAQVPELKLIDILWLDEGAKQDAMQIEIPQGATVREVVSIIARATKTWWYARVYAKPFRYKVGDGRSGEALSVMEGSRVFVRFSQYVPRPSPPGVPGTPITVPVKG
jgi:hypothetical protein